MSIFAEETQNDGSEMSDLTTKNKGFLYGEFCRKGAFEEDFNRVLAFSGGPHPFLRERGDDLANAVQAAALSRPVPVYFEGEDVYYDSEADNRRLADSDALLGVRMAWDGSGFDVTEDQSINLVQNARNGFQLASLGTNQQGLGPNGYRAHGIHAVTNIVQTIVDIRTAARKRDNAAEAAEEAEDDSKAHREAYEDYEAAIAELNAAEERLHKLLTFLDLTYEESILVDKDAGVFMSTGEGPNADKVAFLGRKVRDHLAERGLEHSIADWRAAFDQEVIEA